MEWGGKVIWSNGTTNSKGVAIAFTRNLKISVVNILPDKDGRYLFAEIALKQKMLCLANIFGPNNDNPVYFLNFFNDHNNFSLYDTILGGDFNIILNNDLDKIGSASQHSNYKAREVVRSHMWAMNLSDFFWIFHPFMKTFTRIQITPFTASRFNFFLVSNSFKSCTQSTNVLPSVRSDHRVVKLVLQFNQFKIGPEY